MAGKSKTKRATATAKKKDVLSYRFKDKRKNNPEVGTVTPDTDPETPKTEWAYDPHIDPALEFDSARAKTEALIDDALTSGDEAIMRAALEQLKRQAAPYLNWAGKAERTSFEVDTVSLHVHERIDPATILAAATKTTKGGKKEATFRQPGLFDAPFENLPLRQALDYYKHDRGWANRLITGDSLLVMNSLLQKESMAGKVQMIYIDPPYGIKYGSNFQPFVNKRDVKDRKDEDLTQEPEMIRAFRDTWELDIHSYLTYLRDRLLLSHELLHESGSIFVQISDENVHRVRALLDEVFGAENFVSQINFRTAMTKPTVGLNNVFDYVLWYARSKRDYKYRALYAEKDIDQDGLETQLQASVLQDVYAFTYRDTLYNPQNGWRCSSDGLQRLAFSNRLYQAGLTSQKTGTLKFVRYRSDFPFSQLDNTWDQQSSEQNKIYVVQTAAKIIARAILLTTDPGDLVLDPTCGSGTTAYVAEQWGRRWITCDTSRVAVTLAKQRLMTASYDYYELKYPHEGLRGGFIYKTVPHVTLEIIANNLELDEIHAAMHSAIETALAALNKALPKPVQEWEAPLELPKEWPTKAKEPFEAFHKAHQAMQKRMDRSIAEHAEQETLYDQPAVSKDKLRITGPFTVEAVPFPTVLSLNETQSPTEADASIARSGESSRQHRWRGELFKTGIRGKGGQMLRFADLEPLPDLHHLHCTGTIADTGERVVVSFGPEYGALEQRQVEMAMREAGELFPRPKMIVFCAFTFDPEAAKDIDQTKGITALKAQMNTDLLTEDLKKARSSNQSFWLMGQPDVRLKKLKSGDYQAEVLGFDYFDTAKGELISGGKGKIAAWSLDTDYDERALFPKQVFFPMAGAKDGWNKLRRDIKAELDESRLDKFHGTVSLPFAGGENGKVAVKIVDDRGIESLKIIPLDQAEG